MTATERPRPATRPRPGRSEVEPAEPVSGGVDIGDLAHFIGYALRRAQIAVFDDFIRSLAEIDIRPAQFSVLMVVGRNPGLKQSQIGAALGIQRTNLVAMIDELEHRGLARRERPPSDRRSHALVLTKAGEACLAAALTLHAKHERRMVDKLGAEGSGRLLDLLARLSA
jgi:DNA-binding MarR family transcriptional regulator